MGNLRPIGISIVLVVITWAVFGQTLGHDFVNHDDPDYVYVNPQVTRGLSLEGAGWALTKSHAYNWHPLTWISHMLDVQMFGLRAGGHHFTSVALHTIAVLLLFLVLWELTDALWRGGFVAALFAIHPLRVESVAWIAERKDVLSGVFFMMTLGAYLYYSRKPSPARYLAVGLLFAFGLMAKSMLVTLPFLLLLLDYWPLERRQRFKKLLVEKIPLLLLSGASCVATLLAQRGAINSLQRLSIGPRIENSLLSYATYLWEMIWPVRLALRSSHVQQETPFWIVVFSAVVLTFISAAVFGFRRTRPYAVTGWLWYLIMLVPVIGIVQVGVQAHADRYTYLPQIGLYVLVTWAIADLTADWRFRRQILGSGAVLVLCLLGWRAWIQASYWRDSESLWRHTLAVLSTKIESDPRFLQPERVAEALLVGDAQYDLATALLVKGRVDEAVGEYEKVLAGRTDYLPETENNLGNALLQKGRAQEAIPYFEKALELRLEHAEEAHYNLGNALLQTGHADEAIAQFRQVLELRPTHAEAHNNLGNALLRKGEVDEARVHFQTYLDLRPDQAGGAHYNLGNALLKSGEVTAAALHLQEAVTLRPDYAEAHNNFGNALFRQGKIEEARIQYERAVELKPAYPEARNNLGNVLLQSGHFDEAMVQFQKALDLPSDHPEVAHYNLGNALLQKGALEEGIAHYRQAIELRPDYAEAHNNLGNALLGRGQNEEAIEHLQKAIESRADYAEAHYNLANALLQRGQLADAIEHYQSALAIRPRYLDARNNLAGALMKTGRVREAIAQYEQALTIDPHALSILNNLAWSLATVSDASLRDGTRAVDLAGQANELAGGSNAIVLHTLAAAYAESRRFPEAIETAQHALELSEAQKNPALTTALQTELALYRANSPYHQP